jgi:hypothetical protein
MHVFLLCLLSGSTGAIAGFLLLNWARRLPPHLVDHQHCDERYTQMHRRFCREISDRDTEIQRIIQGLS